MPSEHVGRWKLSVAHLDKWLKALLLKNPAIVAHLDKWLKALLLKNPAIEPASGVMRYCVIAQTLTVGWELCVPWAVHIAWLGWWTPAPVWYGREVKYFGFVWESNAESSVAQSAVSSPYDSTGHIIFFYLVFCGATAQLWSRPRHCLGL